MQYTCGVAGRVTAIEFDTELAARARANLAQTPHVRAVHGDGTRAMFEPADVIYVNAGATRPADAWLDRLKEGGRLILPLTADGFERRGPDKIAVLPEGLGSRLDQIIAWLDANCGVIGGPQAHRAREAA
jgi:protein-L-isoaspartate(D-aspartate) O-methyltransferase